MKTMRAHPGLTILAVVGLCVTAGLLYYTLFRGLEVGGVDVPKPAQLHHVASLPQGWSAEEAYKYHYTSQGTRILPLSWFMALESPSPDPLFPGPRLASREYLSRFGFLYDPARPETTPEADARRNPRDNRNDLPIGFAVDTWGDEVDYVDPPIRRPTKMVGLTCAACHTGRLDFYNETGPALGVLIEGGSAMINLGKFQEAVGQALFWTVRYRQSRFTEEVALAQFQDEGVSPTGQQLQERKDEIAGDLERFIKSGILDRRYAQARKLYLVEGGFSRTDALGLIGNRFFGPLNNENQTVTDAPVNFPALWDTSWFDWVQYNASIRMPLARNIGEALGVGAAVRPARDENETTETTVRIDNLAWMEDFLGGEEPLPSHRDGGTSYGDGLRPPRWDDLARAVAEAGGLDDPEAAAAMTINPKLRDEGAELYANHCARCHLPPRHKLRDELKVAKSKYWEEDARSHKKFLRLRVIDLSEVGTDPNQAANFYRRFATVPNPRFNVAGFRRDADDPAYLAVGYPRTGASETISAAEGLYRITSILRMEHFRKSGKDEAETKNLFDEGQKAKRWGYDRYRTLPIARGNYDEGESEANTDAGEILLNDLNAILDREAMEDVIRGNLGYKARPLDGVWATPPYFHNGSVPSLEEVLTPAEGRSAKFYLGTMRYDPIRVGYDPEHFPGASLMDTTLPGNSNAGHEFRNFTLEEFETALNERQDLPKIQDNPPGPRWSTVLGVDPEKLSAQAWWEARRDLTARILGQVRARNREPGEGGVVDRPVDIKNPNFIGVRGVLDPEFTPQERRALIEYLKTL